MLNIYFIFKLFCSGQNLTVKWSSSAVTYSTTAPPLSTRTTDVMTHTPHSADPLWQTPGLQSDSRITDKRQSEKKINSTAKIKPQTFMCRAKTTCSPFLSVWFNRKLTLAKEQNTKTGNLPVKHWGHGNSQHTLVCGTEMTTTTAAKN